MFKSVLVAVDGSECAMRAVDLAAELAAAFGIRVLILSVYRHFSLTESTHSLVRVRHQPVSPTEALREFARDVVNTAAARAREQGAAEVETFVEKGHPSRTIVDFGRRKGVDAILLGSRGLGDIGSPFLLGSVSHKVNSLAECTCITVK